MRSGYFCCSIVKCLKNSHKEIVLLTVTLQHKTNCAQNNTDQGIKIMHVHMKEHKLFPKCHTPAEKEFLLHHFRKISWQTYKA